MPTACKPEGRELFLWKPLVLNLNILIKKLKSIANKGGISPKFVLIVIRHIFKNSSKVNILLFITYYFKTINMGGRNWQDASIFIASLFGIHKKSFIYKQVKNSKFL